MKSDQKRKKNRQYTRSSFIIPAFLFKTYEILEVFAQILYFRTLRTSTLFLGMKREMHSW